MALDLDTAKNQMTEIARMAYGSGIFEGTSGGKGNIGLVTGMDGQARVIKFNTHFYERGGTATADQIKSSNALRARLLAIAETLNTNVLGELRQKLGLGEGEDAASCKTLLTRQVVASALKMINKDAMSDAVKNIDTASLKSVTGTKFDAVLQVVENQALERVVTEAAQARLQKVNDVLQARGTETEKARAATFTNTIVTSANIQALKNRLLQAKPDMSSAAIKNITASLISLFAEINLRQTANGRTVDSFETLMKRFAGKDSQIKLLDFTLNAEQRQMIQGRMKDWLREGFMECTQKHKFHEKTGVHMLAIREFGFGSITSINGKTIGADPVGEDIDVDGQKITLEDLKQDKTTGALGTDRKDRLAIHEMLLKEIPDRKMRSFITFVCSMSDGIKGLYSHMLDLPAPDNLNNGTPTSFLYMAETRGFKGMPFSLNGEKSSKGVYTITTEPDQVGADGQVVKGKIKVVVSHAEGFAYRGDDVAKLTFEKEGTEVELCVTRQPYETTIVIDPNVIDANGIPSFTVEEPVVK